MQNRLKSKVVWLSIIAQIVLLATMVNPEVADIIKIVSIALVEIATIIGILNDPTSSDKF